MKPGITQMSACCPDGVSYRSPVVLWNPADSIHHHYCAIL